MKITIKSLKKIPYEVELSSEDLSIKDLKTEIEKTHGFEAESIKIMFKGSMLDDKKLIKDYKIAEGDTLTMMSSKVKPQNINNNPEANKIHEESKENKSNTNNNTNTNNVINKNENSTKPKSTTQNLASGLINSLSTNYNSSKEPEKDYSAEEKQLAEMGFNSAEALNAVKAAKGNLERAVDFLYNGIPANTGALSAHNPSVPLLQEFYDPAEEEFEEGEEGDFNGEIPLTFEIDPHMLDSLDLKDPNSLKTIASFVKVLISEDPSSLQNLLEDIEETNPEIIEFIKEYEDEFKQLISTPLEDKDLEKFLPIANNPNLNGKTLSADSDNDKNAKENNEKDKDKAENHEDSEMHAHAAGLDIEGLKSGLSEAEKESVERLKVLGFSEEEVCQAFLACEKNEMLTANFLLENMFKDHNSMDVDGNLIV